MKKTKQKERRTLINSVIQSATIVRTSITFYCIKPIKPVVMFHIGIRKYFIYFLRILLHVVLWSFKKISMSKCVNYLCCKAVTSPPPKQVQVTTALLPHTPVFTDHN